MANEKIIHYFEFIYLKNYHKEKEMRVILYVHKGENKLVSYLEID